MSDDDPQLEHIRLMQELNPMPKGHVAGPNPQDRSEGVAAAMQGWRCVCGRLNGASDKVCAVCGETYAHVFAYHTWKGEPPGGAPDVHE